ncbi:hypothetical protein GCM10010401_22590 [Rarobacter faecitabidus]|uniref:Uncharacterized protein n=1 Tax=Rarobacter faecitabidus TaxID=13243 RepID=A0A542ZVV4_RARFA|nr:hypothetical protein [Rarobacter faecitabidus]TQL64461.1 hypothetical protein FB461_0965 [Rarobacter faecitabidus]
MNRLQSLRGHRDDGVAMATAIFLMLVVLGLSAILLALVIMEVKPTLVNAKSTRTIAAAQAGLDATVSQIRAAVGPDPSGETMGDIHKLPCLVSGNVDGSGTPTRFEATVKYYLLDPSDKSAQWRNDAANQIQCSTGGGWRGLRAVPGYALVTSQGADSNDKILGDAVDRKIEAVYQFSLKVVNTTGGRIYSEGKGYCLVASSVAAGSGIFYRDASSADCAEPTDQNRWEWKSDYMIHLASSKGAGTDLCISGRPPGSGSGEVATTLQPCTTTLQDPLGQRLSWRDGGTWQGQNAANTDYAQTSLRTTISATNLAGLPLLVGNPVRTDGVAWSAFDPEPNVGAGAASHDTSQMVNLLQFGRCMDVFRDKLWMPYNILYPCKQDPASLTTGTQNFRWNHKWVYAEPDAGTTSKTTQIVVKPTIEGTNGFAWYGTYINTPFCLLAPTTKGFPASDSSKAIPPFNKNGVDMRTYYFPRFTDGNIYYNGQESLPSGFGPKCSNTQRAWWLRTTASGDPMTSWTFRPTSDLTMCLSAAGPVHHSQQRNKDEANVKNLTSSGAYNYYVDYGQDMNWSTVIIEKCDGSMAQKWNADPNDPGSPLKDFVELNRSTG